MQSHTTIIARAINPEEYELELFRTNNIINEAITQLRCLVNVPTEQLKPTLKGIIRLLESSCDKTHIQEILFIDDCAMQRDFLKNLLADFPNLTASERKLCRLTAQNLTTKQISDITRQSVGAVNKLRLRLRKKLGLTGTHKTLLQFLDTYRK